jgi:hypothetical protein
VRIARRKYELLTPYGSEDAARVLSEFLEASEKKEP